MSINKTLCFLFVFATASSFGYEACREASQQDCPCYYDEDGNSECSCVEENDFQEGAYHFPFPDQPPSQDQSRSTSSREKCRAQCGFQDFHLATGCSCCVRECPDGSHRLEYQCGRPSDYHPESQRVYDMGRNGIWLPEDPPMFRPFAADPRQTTYSVGRRYNDNALPKNVIPISFWDNFPLYRRLNVWPWGGMLQVDIDGALWAVFDPDTFSAPLINADYYVGVPITYAWCNWSLRLRFYHISCHIGDEYLLNHPNFDRRNPSSETVDLFVSHDLTNEIRLYGGLGWVLNMDESYRVKRFLAEAGAELRISRLGFCDPRHNICGRPFYAMHFRYKPDFRKHIDATYALGYEFAKCCGARKRWRLFIEYHDGYSVEGQFAKEPTNYFAFRLSYGY